eukprot:TRINITY_DN6908_c0_g2_i1.p1 TRINITY_DN6908_c0_g2~~TRINITY_DN6908_c0_g2_i1.p1  ORF type:complete len:101 (-),score=2.22 TRINITY_DN6908_c0_g2_i1:139-441(-)
MYASPNLMLIEIIFTVNHLIFTILNLWSIQMNSHFQLASKPHPYLPKKNKKSKPHPCQYLPIPPCTEFSSGPKRVPQRTYHNNVVVHTASTIGSLFCRLA